MTKKRMHFPFYLRIFRNENISIFIAPVTSKSNGYGYMLIVAHRGASYKHTENTMAAFGLAWHEGADAIECDVHCDLDGKLWVHHDASTGRLGDRDLVIAQSSSGELKKVRLGEERHAMPSLAETLASMPAKGEIFIELKGQKRIVPALAATIAASQLDPRRIFIIAFALRHLREIHTAGLPLRCLWLLSGNALNQQQKQRAIIAEARSNQLFGLGLDAATIDTGKWASACRESGLALGVWTVNDAIEAAALARFDLFSLTTDYPGALRKALEKGR
jgi:glycerophosphoryl diester phosphodiesterase